MRWKQRQWSGKKSNAQRGAVARAGLATGVPTASLRLSALSANGNPVTSRPLNASEAGRSRWEWREGPGQTHQDCVVALVALRQNQPAQSGRLERQMLMDAPALPAPLCAARLLAARAVPPRRLTATFNRTPCPRIMLPAAGRTFAPTDVGGYGARGAKPSPGRSSRQSRPRRASSRRRARRSR